MSKRGRNYLLVSCLSSCLFVCFVCLFVYLFVFLFACLFVCLLVAWLFVSFSLMSVSVIFIFFLPGKLYSDPFYA